MIAQHTPGPWNVGQDSTAIEASGAIIARTFHWANQYTPIHESYANAKLIAAAPEMLDALQVIAADIENRVRLGLDAPTWYSQTRAAIAKATGAA